MAVRRNLISSLCRIERIGTNQLDLGKQCELDFNQAVSKSYKTLEKLSFEGMYYRKDIGFDL